MKLRNKTYNVKQLIILDEYAFTKPNKIEKKNQNMSSATISNTENVKNRDLKPTPPTYPIHKK